MSENVKPVVKKSEILDLLEQGKTRKEIAEHYGITMADVRKIFQHPDLKNKRPKASPGFVFEDDIQDADGESGKEQSGSENTQEAPEEGAFPGNLPDQPSSQVATEEEDDREDFRQS